MTTKTPIIIATIIFGLLVVPSLANVAYSQAYLGNVGEDGQTGAQTLEEALKLAQGKVVVASENPIGSGTPILAADGVVGASIIAAGIFGGIAAVLIKKAKGGRYVAQGLG